MSEAECPGPGPCPCPGPSPRPADVDDSKKPVDDCCDGEDCKDEDGDGDCDCCDEEKPAADNCPPMQG